MMRFAWAMGVVAAIMASQAVAETRPVSLQSDPRIRQYSYDRDTVYRLDLFMRFITAVQFEQGEQVESVQVGDSASWEITRLNRGDVLAVKPLIEGAATNMTVYTDRRVYTFELRARSARVGSRELNYRVSFRYPEVEARQRQRAREVASRPQDFNYLAAGRAEFSPNGVYDDGVSTYFSFPDGAPRPAIFRVDAAGREAIVNIRQTPNGAVVDSVSDRWTLRIGDQEICIAHGDVIGSVRGGESAVAANTGGPRTLAGGVVLK